MTNQPEALQYADRDHTDLGSYYMRHVSAMTGEALHSKSAIAAELAHRDREIDRLQAENANLNAGYAAARLEIESLQARIKTMAEEHADELMVAHLDGRMRAAQPAGAQAAPELTETAVTAKNPAAPVSSFEDSRTQAVYEVLVNDNYPPAGSNEHWEGWKARLIVDALFPIEAPAAVARPSDPEIDALVMNIGPTEGIRRDSRDLTMDKLRVLVRRALATWGHVKVAPAALGDAPTDAGPISRQWLTVVYRGVEAVDEVQQICTHPKVSAMSWSHAIHDSYAARKQGANHD